MPLRFDLEIYCQDNKRSPRHKDIRDIYLETTMNALGVNTHSIAPESYSHKLPKDQFAKGIKRRLLDELFVVHSGCMSRIRELKVFSGPWHVRLIASKVVGSFLKAGVNDQSG